jgi:molecular chaperone DnaJ/curved DNA-binding protein
MHGFSDYYVLLGVGYSAGSEEIKRAFRRLARRYHPDRHNGDATATERFKAVREAYHVLSDPERRRAYDLDHSGVSARNGQPAGGGANGTRRSGEHGFAPPSLDGHAFAALFEQAGAEPPESLGAVFARFFDEPVRKGADVEAQAHLTFEEALQGGKTPVRLPQGTCIRISVPRGVRHGLKIRIPGRGNEAPVPDGEPGDLYVTFRVEPSEHFRREGDDLHVVETVSALEAMLGGTRCIPNAYGKLVKLPIPPGTQPGDRLRLRGQGVATTERTGDLYVEVQVAIPRDLSEAQRKALATCARKHGLL